MTYITILYAVIHQRTAPILSCILRSSLYVVAFFCQQAVEKALKALFILKKQESPRETHSLIFLAKETNVPRQHFGLLQDLTPEFLTTGYPDVVGEAPYKLYHKDKAKDYLKRAKELLKWIESQIKKQ